MACSIKIKEEKYDESDITIISPDDSKMKVDTTPPVIKEEKTYKCGFCRKLFSTSIKLLDHIKTHKGDKIFVKTEIKTYDSLHQLRTHSRKHDLQKIYKCELCENNFRHLTKLREHLKTHKKEYTCGECYELFHTEKQLFKHLNNHYEKMVKSKESLEKVYKCEVCESSFSLLTKLHSHLKSHKKEYTCGECYDLFYTEKQFMKHLDDHYEQMVKSKQS